MCSFYLSSFKGQVKALIKVVHNIGDTVIFYLKKSLPTASNDNGHRITFNFLKMKCTYTYVFLCLCPEENGQSRRANPQEENERHEPMLW